VRADEQNRYVVAVSGHSALFPYVAPAETGGMTTWEYLVVPLESAGTLKKRDSDLKPDHLNELGAQGWEAVGLSLKKGDLVAWPVVLLKRVVGP
jgi:hypothetical protein